MWKGSMGGWDFQEKTSTYTTAIKEEWRVDMCVQKNCDFFQRDENNHHPRESNLLE